MRRWGGDETGRVPERATVHASPCFSGLFRQTGAPPRGLALLGRGGRIIEAIRFSENRNGRAEHRCRYLEAIATFERSEQSRRRWRPPCLSAARRMPTT